VLRGSGAVVVSDSVVYVALMVREAASGMAARNVGTQEPGRPANRRTQTRCHNVGIEHNS